MATYYFQPELLQDSEKKEIIAKINLYSKNVDGSDCILWDRSSNGRGYPQMALGKKYETRCGTKRYNPGHILFSLEYNITLNEAGKEMSHLCHNKNCIFIGHFSYEPRAVNESRRNCLSTPGGHCLHHGEYPDCVFNMQ